MRGTYCYLPILRARHGAFNAVESLSPLARARLTPLFDFPLPVLKDGETLDTQLAKRADGIRRCWDIGRPVYVDVHDFPPELRTSKGTTPIAYIVDHIRGHGGRPIPVTGTEYERGAQYIQTVRSLVSGNRDGACLRLDRDLLNEPPQMHTAVLSVLHSLALGPEEVDAVLDFGYVGRETVESVRTVALDALQVLAKIGVFRNISIAGTSIPEHLGKYGEGIVLRHARVELQVWDQVIAMTSSSGPIALSDFGIVGAHYVPPNKFVSTPARIRYTTPSEHVFRRTKPGRHSEIARDLLASADYLGPTFSIGDQFFHRSANGRTDGPGNAGQWVYYDINHHLELVSDQAWQRVRQQGAARMFALSEPNPQPWLQPEILSF